MENFFFSSGSRTEEMAKIASQEIQEAIISDVLD